MTFSLDERLEMLSFLSPIVGANIWSFKDALLCRELEKDGLVRIVKVRNPPPKNGAMRMQPFFGVKIKAAGRKFLEERYNNA